MVDAPRAAAADGHTPRPNGRIADLLQAARGGDRAALGQLFESARQQLHDAAARSLPPAIRGRLGPSDIVQETAVDMQRDFAGFNGTTAEDLFAWLRSILNNNLIDAIALEMARSPDATRKLWHRAMRRLNEELAAAESQPSADTPAEAPPAADREDSGQSLATAEQ